MKLVQRHWCTQCRLSGGKGTCYDEKGHVYYDVGECPNIDYHKETDIVLDETK